MTTKPLDAIREGDDVIYHASKKIALLALVIGINAKTVKIELGDRTRVNVKPSKLSYPPEPEKHRKEIRTPVTMEVRGLDTGASGLKRGRNG